MAPVGCEGAAWNRSRSASEAALFLAIRCTDVFTPGVDEISLGAEQHRQPTSRDGLGFVRGRGFVDPH